MSFKIDVCHTIRQQGYIESCLKQVFACIAYAVFSGDSAYLYFGRVKQFENFSKSLPGPIHTVKSGVLLDTSVAAFVKCQLFLCVWSKSFMDLSSACACDAM